MSIRSWATPLTAGSFVLVMVTGLLMLVGVRSGLVTPAHEVLGLVFVIGSIFHLYLNWKPMLGHLRRRGARWIVGVFMLLTLLAVLPWPAGETRARPDDLLLNANVAMLARMSGHSSAAMLSALQARGVQSADSVRSLTELAKANNQSPRALLMMLLYAEK